jgi:putative thioredoxin
LFDDHPMDQPTFVLEGTRENFPLLVLENSQRGPVLVDFWSPRLGPSLRQRERLLRLAEQFAGRFLLVSVDTDRETALVAEQGVRSLPSCRLFRHGRAVEQVFGLQPEDEYRALIDRHLPSVADPVQAAALHAWRQGDGEGAVRILAEGALAEPERIELPLLLAKFLIRLERPADAQAVLGALPESLAGHVEVESLRGHLELILAARSAPPAAELAARVAASPGDLDARFQLAALSLLADDVDQAFAQLLEVIRRAPVYREGGAERALRALFDLLGSDDERVRRCRRELMNLIR